MQLLVQRTGLAAEIDASLKLLQVHQPYHESDHVLHIAYNILCGEWIGTLILGSADHPARIPVTAPTGPLRERRCGRP